MTRTLRNPWIDPRVHQITPALAEAYMRRHGWRAVPFPRPQVRLYEGPPADDGRPMTQLVPVAEQADDYGNRVIDLITNLAVIEQRHAVQVLEEMLGVTTPSANGAPAAKAPEAAPAPTA
jgi:hypothetical protein